MMLHNICAIRGSIITFTLFLIFLLNPFADALTGYLVGKGMMSENAAFSPSQIFRLFLTMILFVQLKYKQKFYFFLVTVFYLLIIEIVSFLLHQYPPGLLNGIISSYKLSFCLLFYLVIDNYVQNNKIGVSDIVRYFILSATIYAVIILISNILGINFDVYGDGLGSKGVFTSGNGLGIFIGVAGLFSLYAYLSERKKKEIIRLILFLYVLVNLLSKAAIILTLAILLISFYYSKRVYKFIIIVGGIALLAYYNSYVIELITTTTSVVTYRYEHADSLRHFLLSGRVEYMDYAFEQYSLDGLLLLRLFFGMGYFVSFRNPYSNSFWEGSSSFLECEAFDMFFMYGLLGLLLYISLFIYILKKAMRIKGKYTSIFKIAWIVIFFHSAFAGHVLFNGMSIIAFVTILIVLNNYQIHNENSISVS